MNFIAIATLRTKAKPYEGQPPLRLPTCSLGQSILEDIFISLMEQGAKFSPYKDFQIGTLLISREAAEFTFEHHPDRKKRMKSGDIMGNAKLQFDLIPFRYILDGKKLVLVNNRKPEYNAAPVEEAYIFTRDSSCRILFRPAIGVTGLSAYIASASLAAITTGSFSASHFPQSPHSTKAT